jgi:cytochrome c peroxidase
MTKKAKFILVCLFVLISFGVFFTSNASASSLDKTLNDRLRQYNVTPMNPGPDFSDEKVTLGKKLFFDRILSGNKDISCAGCHHPLQGSSDGLPLSIGTKYEGTHFNRRVGPDREFVARNAQDIWNRGSPRWRTLFRDMRVRNVKNTDILLTPAGFELPDTVSNLQAAQAMIPVTARTEMRGERGDTTVTGEPNTIASIPEGQFEQIWGAYWERLMRIDEYRELFREAYPEKSLSTLSFAHAANAIAAFQIEAFTFLNSPWDRFLNGEDSALTAKQKKGALLFYGKAKCAQCHSGPLMTDQRAHNIAVPQLGPGKEPDEPFDLGFYSQTGNPSDRFAFRTPPLRNVTVTGPWMHNGTYSTLEAAVRHHLNPRKALRNYNPNQLKYDLRSLRVPPLFQHELMDLQSTSFGESLSKTVKVKESHRKLLLRNLDPVLKEEIDLTEQEFSRIMAFLKSLTSPSVKLHNGRMSAPLKQTIPDTVPSGLPFPGSDLPGGPVGRTVTEDG